MGKTKKKLSLRDRWKLDAKSRFPLQITKSNGTKRTIYLGQKENDK
jgi:hypothetical protein